MTTAIAISTGEGLMPSGGVAEPVPPVALLLVPPVFVSVGAAAMLLGRWSEAAELCGIIVLFVSTLVLSVTTLLVLDRVRRSLIVGRAGASDTGLLGGDTDLPQCCCCWYASRSLAFLGYDRRNYLLCSPLADIEQPPPLQAQAATPDA